jgi:hypothetical protein
MAVLNENTTMRGTIMVQSGEQNIPAVEVTANINGTGTSMVLSINTINIDLFMQNIPDIQAQLDIFIETLKQKMSTNGAKFTLWR